MYASGAVGVVGVVEAVAEIVAVCCIIAVVGVPTAVAYRHNAGRGHEAGSHDTTSCHALYKENSSSNTIA